MSKVEASRVYRYKLTFEVDDFISQDLETKIVTRVDGWTFTISPQTDKATGARTGAFSLELTSTDIIGEHDFGVTCNWVGPDGVEGEMPDVAVFHPASRRTGTCACIATSSHFRDGRRTNSGHRYDYRTQRKFNFVWTVTLKLETATHAMALAVLQDLSARVAQTLSIKLPHDVRLVFPPTSSSEQERELWTSSAFLLAASPYFKPLLEGNSAETISSSSSKKRRLDSLIVPKLEEGVDATPSSSSAAAAPRAHTTAPDDDADSDTEADSLAPPSTPSTTNTNELTYRQVRITSALYSTYRAVLVWLHTGHITFAPLSSSFHPSLSPTTTRLEALKSSSLASPSLPIPVSPKSIYRLAHLIDLPSLASLALTELETQLSVTNVAFELFGSTSEVYEQVRKVEMEFVVRHWGEVKRSRGMEVVERRMREGKVPQFGELVWEISKRT
ncbi:BTB/POZ-like domain containing protein [Pseudohyphozyma bogoriensis]|nr:BTB/POZ-like domain containing protein [Pseudohyphozyma bogoriensis]